MAKQMKIVAPASVGTCWRRREGFYDHTNRLRLREDHAVEPVYDDGSAGEPTHTLALALECERQDLWERVPDRRWQPSEF